MGIQSLRAAVHATNERSVRLVNRVGFEQVGTAPDLDMYDGKLTCVLLFVLHVQG